MIRQSKLPTDKEYINGIRMRGTNVSRIESFSDAVFGFALTLLVVSLEVPKDFDGFVKTMYGFFGFAVCFGMLYQVWTNHYTYFRKFGLGDSTVRIANAVLLFVVVAFVYPLKFLFSTVLTTWFVGTVFHIRMASSVPEMTGAQVRTLFLIYGSGFASVELIFSFLYFHALKRSESLELTPSEIFETKFCIVDRLCIASVPIGAMLLALVLPDRFVGISGFFYSAIGIVKSIDEGMAGAKRRKAGHPDPAKLP